jgi:hypothetical protein
MTTVKMTNDTAVLARLVGTTGLRFKDAFDGMQAGNLACLDGLGGLAGKFDGLVAAKAATDPAVATLLKQSQQVTSGLGDLKAAATDPVRTAVSSLAAVQRVVQRRSSQPTLGR